MPRERSCTIRLSGKDRKRLRRSPFNNTGTSARSTGLERIRSSTDQSILTTDGWGLVLVPQPRFRIFIGVCRIDEVANRSDAYSRQEAERNVGHDLLRSPTTIARNTRQSP